MRPTRPAGRSKGFVLVSPSRRAELIPTQINWQVPSNSQAHHTNCFAGTELCARRGQKVDFKLYFNRAPQAGESLAFVAETGKGPQPPPWRGQCHRLQSWAGGWGAQFCYRKLLSSRLPCCP